jgi:hypothetical protein
VRSRVLVGRLVRDEQLDGRAECRILEAPCGGERPERVAEVRGEEVVDHLQHLGARAVVLSEREHAARGLAPLTENLHVGVPEPVDRLELVPDEEEVLGREQIDQLALEAIRVLELVDEHRPEAPALAFSDRRVVAEQIARGQLEVLEVERRLGGLRGGVGIGKAPQEVLEEASVARRHLVERRLLDGTARFFVARGPLTLPATRCEAREVEQPLGRRRILEQLQRSRGAVTRRLRRRVVLDQTPRCLPELFDPRFQAGTLGDLEHELPAGRTERLVDPGQHPPQAACPVRR